MNFYTLKENDDINTVCEKFQITKKELLKMNGMIDENLIRSGREIKVPNINPNYFNTYVIEKGDSLYKIARMYNINPELLASMNGLNMEDYIYPNQELLIPKNGYSYYITKDGDTLNLVASMFKTNVPNLLNDNETI